MFGKGLKIIFSTLIVVMIGDINTESVIKKLIIVQSYRPLFFT